MAEITCLGKLFGLIPMLLSIAAAQNLTSKTVALTEPTAACYDRTALPASRPNTACAKPPPDSGV